MSSPVALLARTDALRAQATGALDPQRRAALGQFLTPSALARFMASFFERFSAETRLLDAGAGVGTLVAAAVGEACARPDPPRAVDVVAYEIDPVFLPYLRETLSACTSACARAGVRFRGEIADRDFLAGGLEPAARCTHAILNPPYKKLAWSSEARRAMRLAGFDTNNLYAAFVAFAIRRLEPGGELVAITPRSFCNGPYFRAFRDLLYRETAIRRVHVFRSRTAAFADDGVLQENVVFHAIKGAAAGKVVVSSSEGPGGEGLSTREVPFAEIVRPGDPERFLRIVSRPDDGAIADALEALPARLEDLGISVSTGRVVDFRVRDHLRPEPEAGASPLVYPSHLRGGAVRWPRVGKKPNALAHAPATAELFLPRGIYVLVKRFSSKEEPRRVVAAVFDPRLVPCERVGFENHLNVFHARGRGLEARVARALARFLNSTLVDAYFRQYSGHTQVNATDLRNLRYPSLAMLRRSAHG